MAEAVPGSGGGGMEGFSIPRDRQVGGAGL